MVERYSLKNKKLNFAIVKEKENEYATTGKIL